jgi:hypothetical protein
LKFESTVVQNRSANTSEFFQITSKHGKFLHWQGAKVLTEIIQ